MPRGLQDLSSLTGLNLRTLHCKVVRITTAPPRKSMASGFKDRDAARQRWVIGRHEGHPPGERSPGSRVPRMLWGSQMLLGAFLLDAAGTFFSPGHFSTVSVTVESSSNSVSRVVGPEAPQDWPGPCLAGFAALPTPPPCCRGLILKMPPRSKPAFSAQPLTGAPS